MELDLVGLAFGVVTAIGTGGAMYGTTRTKLRRLEADVHSVREAAAEHAGEDSRTHTAMIDRLARIETKLDNIIERFM